MTGVVVSCNGRQITTTPLAGVTHGFQFPTTAGNDYNLGFAVSTVPSQTGRICPSPISCISRGNLLRITFPGTGNNRIEVLDCAGRVAFSKSVDAGTFIWDRVRSTGMLLHRGIYFLRLSSNGRMLLKKIVDL